MHTKIMLVVSRNHWRCLTCKVRNKRSVSVDQHLLNTHPEFDSFPLSHSSASVVEACSHSDGELDAVFQYKDLFLNGFCETDVKEISQADLQHEDSFTEPAVSHKRSVRRKRKKLRKPMPSFPKLRQIDNTETNARSGTDSDVDYAADNGDTGSENGDKNKEHWTCAQRISVRLRTKLGSRQTKMKTSKMRSRKEFISSASEQMPLRNPLKLKLNPFPATKSSKLPVTGKERSAPKRPLKKDKATDSSPSVVKEKFHVPAHQVEMQPRNKPEPKTVKSKKEKSSEEEKSQPVKRHRKSAASRSVIETIEAKPDKSNIATSCVPWLLDTGRKAGDKVTKRTRRSLPPEEKQAVRELYGVPLLKQRADVPSLNVPRETTSQHCAAENQAVGIVENFSPSHPVNMTSMEPLPTGDNNSSAASSHRNYMLNILSSSTRDFFTPDNSRDTQQNLCPNYNSGYTQLSHHVSHYTSQVSEFYPSTVNILPQESNMIHFQGFSQGSGPTMSTPRTEDHTGRYLGQSFDMNSIPQSQIMPAAVGSTPCSVLQTPAQSTSSTSKTDLAQGSQTPGISNPELQHEDLVLDSNPDNQCKVCKEHFQTPEKYEDHQKELAGFEAVECKRCTNKFHRTHQLNLHVFSAHETEKRGFCFTCDQDAAGMEDLENHVHCHVSPHRDLPLRDLHFHDCRVCSEELPNAYAPIRTHYYQHHAVHTCNQCYLTFKDLQAYKDHHAEAHREQHHILCSICGSKFENSGELDEHAPCPEDIWAEDGKGEACFKCSQWCPNRAVVEAHRKQHRSQEDVEAYRQGAKVGFPCASCEKVFKNKHACRRHMKMVHEGVSCYKHYCEYCGKGFLTKGHMRDHIALHHLNIKRYKCDYCEQQFVCGPTLRRHVRVEHTKHRPYQCPHCDQRFFEKTPLQRHLTIHTGLAPFMCEHCGKGFYTKHSFRNHRSTHSTVKEFVCTGCQKGFTRKYNLHAHAKVCKML